MILPSGFQFDDLYCRGPQPVQQFGTPYNMVTPIRDNKSNTSLKSILSDDDIHPDDKSSSSSDNSSYESNISD